MKKLLILGSDFGTISVVREAHKMGIYVIVADLMETSPTKELADEAWLLSSTDTETLVQKSFPPSCLVPVISMCGMPERYASN